MKNWILNFIIKLCKEQIQKSEESEVTIGMGGKCVYVKKQKS